ncbi:hypothetical protein DCAR_0521710 [Daucus carota subsp. sativus]|uniref:Ubiquitin-like protease family profile domain-containing protein n=1 Tax=Daucus carota subsp. sativus TaxID=79200 RepID=A0AAF0X5S7_DAUCS|nr:hypothetical protein DCAR_0521710 [Daucus carota subsp. sativus]
MGNTLIQTVSNGLVDQRLVRFKGDINRCSVYNWCSYLLQSLKNCKKEWAKDPATKYFCGPLVFLILRKKEKLNQKKELMECKKKLRKKDLLKRLFLYFDTANAILDNSNCISFPPKQLVTTQVVDAFCHILNMNEMYKAEQSPLRLFVPHHVTVYVLRHSNSEEKEQHFKKFVRDFDDVLAAYDHIKFNDVDLIFFSMTVSDHHYLLCFNIKKPSFEVIDSSALQPDFDAKYQYMVLKNHLKAKDIASLVPVRLEMKWRTEHNHIDCGLFVMRHMEHYQGVSKSWDCGLVVEGKVQDQQLDVLRTRYAHQILLHECNKQKHHVEYQIFEEHVKKAELEKQTAKEKKEKDTKAPAKRQRRA